VIRRIVVDTNVLVSGTMTRGGFPRRVADQWRTDAAVLLMSDRQRAELADVVTRPKVVESLRLTESARDDMLAAVDGLGVIVAPGPSPIPVRDPDDEPILALAFWGNASHLITGDRDLLVLDGDPGLGNLRILTPRAFCEEVLDS
jgi:uncharacterized protein